MKKPFYKSKTSIVALLGAVVVIYNAVTDGDLKIDSLKGALDQAWPLLMLVLRMATGGGLALSEEAPSIPIGGPGVRP